MPGFTSFPILQSQGDILHSVTFVPLGFGNDLVAELLSGLAIAIVNLFVNILVDLISVFLFFPNPSLIGGLDQLWFSSLVAFTIIWMVAALSWLGTLQVFPYNENLTPWRFVDRSLIAFIAVIISRPGLSLIVELVEMIGKFIYPGDYAIAITRNGLDGAIANLVGSGLLILISLVILYSASVMVILLFLGVLGMRAFMVYTVYATFPLWMGLWIVDEGPLKYGNMVSQVIFRAFAMLLGVGIFISAILATGGAIAGYQPDAATGSSTPETDSGAYINDKHLSTVSQPGDAAVASTVTSSVFAIRIIAIFGALWGAFGITTSFLGMLISVGGSAAASSSASMQRGMPGGGAQTATDKTNPSGGGGGGGGSSSPAGSMPGSHGNGPGESSSFVSEQDIPSQDGRKISSQAWMAGGKAKDAVSGAAEKVSEAAGTTAETIGDIKQNGVADTVSDTRDNNDYLEGVTDAGVSAAVGTAKGLEKGARAFDATAEVLSTSQNRTIGTEVQRIRDNPIVGGSPSSAEMLDENDASFIEDGEFKEDLDIGGDDWDDDHYFHPNSASGYEPADPDTQEVFADADKEMYRGYRTGTGDNVIVASGTDAEGEAVHMTSNARRQIEQDTDMDLNTPFAEYDPDAGVIVANEKQGRSLEELDPHEEFARSDLDSDSYVDEVSASIMVGDERGARGDVLFDEDGKAFNPNVDGATSEFTQDEIEELAEEAAETGIATQEEILERVEDASNQIYDARKADGYASNDPVTDVASDAAHHTSTDLYDMDGGQGGATINQRENVMRRNLKTASTARQKFK